MANRDIRTLTGTVNPTDILTRADADQRYDPLGAASSQSDGNRGEIFVSNGYWSINPGVVDLANLAPIAATSLIGNSTGAAAIPTALSSAAVTAMLSLFNATTRGLAPPSGGGTTNFLRADGTWAAAGGTGTVTSVGITTANGVSGSTAFTTTAPRITVTLGDITPSSVAATGNVTGLNLAGTNSGDQTINLVGDITGTGTGSFATAIGLNKVLDTMLAQMPTATIRGRVSAGTGNVEQLSGTQVTSLLNPFTTALKGVAPASGGGTTTFLRADGTWALPAYSTATVTSVSVSTANGVSGTVATATTTPAISLTLGAITPTSVVATGAVTGTNLSGTNTGDQTVTLTGDITGTGTGSFATAIGTNKVLDTMMAQMPTATIRGRISAGVGNVEGLSGTQVTTLLDPFTTALKGLAPASGGGTVNYLRADGTWATPAGSGSGTVTSVLVLTANGVSGSVATGSTTPRITFTLGAITPSSVVSTGNVTGTNLSGTNTGDQTVTLTGDITGTGTGSFATTIGANKVLDTMMAQMPTATLRGRISAGTGNVEGLSGTQVTTLLDPFTSALKGLAPASGGGTATFLRADGTWSAPASSVTTVGTLPATGNNGDLVFFSGSLYTWAGTAWRALNNNVVTQSDVSGLTTSLALKAPIDNPTFTTGLTTPGFNSTSDSTVTGILSLDGATGALANIAYAGAVKGTISATATSFDLKAAAALPMTIDAPTGVTLKFNTASKLSTTNSGIAIFGAASCTTPTTGLNSTIIATTAYVQSTLSLASVSTTGGATTLTTIQAGSGVIIVTGALTSAATIYFGSSTAAYLNRPYIVQNATTGAFTLTLQACATTPSNSIVVTQGLSSFIVTNGASVFLATTDLPNFTSTVEGVVPPSGGGTTNFLRADGTWATPPGGGGTGTVTNVSVATANGVSGSVTTSTTTPAITLSLGAITPTSVVASGSVTGSNISGTHSGTSSGTNTGDQTVTLTGDITGTGTGSFATAIGANKIIDTMLAQVPTSTFRGRATAGTGNPEVLTTAQAKTLLNLTGTNSGDQTITLTGDITGSGTGSFATAIGANKVLDTMMAQMPTATIRGRISAGTGNVEGLSGTQVTTLLDPFTSTLKGLAPASAGGTVNYLRADGTWAAPTAGGVATVGALPASGSNGDLVFFSGSLYTWNGTAWKALNNNVVTQSDVSGLTTALALKAPTDAAIFTSFVQTPTLTLDDAAGGSLGLFYAGGQKATLSASASLVTFQTSNSTPLSIFGQAALTIQAVGATTIDGSSVTLKFANANKLATSSTGVTITGAATCTTPVAGTNSTTMPTTAYVQTALTLTPVTTTGGVTTLTTVQAGSGVVIVTGALTSNATINFGSAAAAFFNRPYIVQNLTTGAFTLTLQACVTTPSNSIVVTQGLSVKFVTNNAALFITNTDLPAFTSTAKGLVPASGGVATTFLCADGTWSTPSSATGTVTSVSVTTANGISGTVATATATPAITLSLGAITPTSVTAAGSVTGSNISGTHSGTSSGANTGDQTISFSGGDITGTGTGTISVVVTARSKRTVFPTSGATWTKDSRAVTVRVQVWGSGGGGGSGITVPGTTGCSGGGGGGGGAYLESTFDAAVLGATEAITIGAGGSGAAGNSGGTSVQGGVGGVTTFGSWFTAYAGGGGGGGGSAANSGGGGGAGLAGAGGTGNVSGGVASSTIGGGAVGGSGTTATYNSNYGGGGGGAGCSNGAGTYTGGHTSYGGAGGGSGGGLSVSPSARAGGTGGSSFPTNLVGTQGGALSGGNGATPAAGITYCGGVGGGGGGSHTTAAAGSGSAGQRNGGGGGGGGSAVTGFSAGNGAAGGTGLIVVTENF